MHGGRVLALDARPAGGAHLRAQRRVARESHTGVSDRRVVASSAEDRRDSLLRHFADATDASREDWPVKRHRLEERDGHSLMPRGHREDVARAHEVWHVVAEARERHALGKSGRLDLFLEVDSERPFAHDREATGAIPPGHARRGGEKDLESFYRHEPPDDGEDDVGRTPTELGAHEFPRARGAHGVEVDRVREIAHRVTSVRAGDPHGDIARDREHTSKGMPRKEGIEREQATDLERLSCGDALLHTVHRLHQPRPKTKSCRDDGEEVLLVPVCMHDVHGACAQVRTDGTGQGDDAEPRLVEHEDLDAMLAEACAQPAFVQDDGGELDAARRAQRDEHRECLSLGAGPEVTRDHMANANHRRHFTLRDLTGASTRSSSATVVRRTSVRTTLLSMRILYVSHFIPHPPTGGASLRNFNIIKGLARDNHVHLVTFTQRDRHPTSARVEKSRAALEVFCEEIEILEVPTDSSRLRWYGMLLANLLSLEPYSTWRFRSAAFERALGAMLDRHTFDVVHVDTIALAWCHHLLRGLPAVLNHHNVESTLLERRAASSRNPASRFYIGLQARKLRRAEADALTRFDGNVSVSEVDSADLRRLAPGVVVREVPNGTDTQFFRAELEVGTIPALVFAGSMGWYPNADAMVLFAANIWPMIREAVPGVEMHLIGSKAPAEVVRLAERDSRFKVLGFVDDVRPTIRDAAVYVVPIRVGGGTRLKILDAMAMGKAIVSHPVGAEGIAVTDGVDIVIAEEPEAFAARVIELLRDSTRREALGRAARETAVARYSWDRIVPGLVRFYREVASAKQGARR